MFHRFALLVAAALVLPAAAQPGGLDPTFGTGGQLTLTPGTSQDAQAVAILPDGRILLAGSLQGNVAVYRLTADGALDASFGAGGVATVDLGGEDSATDLAVLADGRIVVTATRSVDQVAEAGFLVGFGPEGQPDPSFGAGGTQPLAGVQGLTGLGVDGAGGLLAYGFGPGDDPDAGDDVLVGRFSPRGVPDGTYGTGGRARFDVGGALTGRIAVFPDGRATVVGSRFTGAFFSLEPFAARLTADGALDPAFGTGGVALLEFGRSFNGLLDVAVDAEDRTVAAGVEADLFTGQSALVVARLTPSGVLDASFAGDGVVSETFDALVAQGTAVLVQPDGRLVVAGAVGSSTAGDLLVARFLPDGTPDAAFGTGGTTRVPGVPDAADTAFGLALDADGRIVAAGSRTTRTGDEPVAVRVVRLLNDVVLSAERPGAAPRLALAHAGPNPSREPVRLALTVAAPGPVRVALYDSLGRQVGVLHDGPLGAGTHALAAGAGLPAGVYVVRAESRGATAVCRVARL